MVDLLVKETVSPTEPGFFMKQLGIMSQGNAAQTQAMAKYLQNCKVETAKRLLAILYDPQTGEMDRKYWCMFGKKTFLG